MACADLVIIIILILKFGKFKGFLMSKINEIWEKSLYIFDRKQKVRLVGLTAILFMETIFELLGVISVYPFIALILNPSMVQTNAFLHFFYVKIGFSSNEAFFVFIAVSIILLYVFKNIFNAIASYLRYGFIFNTKREIGVRLMRDYMKENYSFFLIIDRCIQDKQYTISFINQ